MTWRSRKQIDIRSSAYLVWLPSSAIIPSPVERHKDLIRPRPGLSGLMGARSLNRRGILYVIEPVSVLGFTSVESKTRERVAVKSRCALKSEEPFLWACSSAGRAPALQAGGRRFDPGHVHQLNSRSLNHLGHFFDCTILVQPRDNRMV